MDAHTKYHSIRLNSRENADTYFSKCKELMEEEIRREIISDGYATTIGEFLAFYCLKYQNKFNKVFYVD